MATAPSAPARGVVVSGPPPAPLDEPRPTPPPSRTRTAWVGGYWHWTGMHYAWIPGHWDAAPPGASWVAPRYFQEGGQYLYEGGGWSRGRRRGRDR
ncbi:MAG: YXWGXW repeat-containing protein [Myxococcales bacterium]|nr:YXWGXW repeat-containing protein [Myxococcales bacterium]